MGVAGGVGSSNESANDVNRRLAEWPLRRKRDGERGMTQDGRTGLSQGRPHLLVGPRASPPLGFHCPGHYPIGEESTKNPKFKIQYESITVLSKDFI